MFAHIVDFIQLAFSLVLGCVSVFLVNIQAHPVGSGSYAQYMIIYASTRLLLLKSCDKHSSSWATMLASSVVDHLLQAQHRTSQLAQHKRSTEQTMQYVMFTARQCNPKGTYFLRPTTSSNTSIARRVLSTKHTNTSKSALPKSYSK